jgi:signal transduction histidine kinase/DNA-binding response OmpR family regulator
VSLYAIIAGSMVAVFVADLFTPLGIAVWVIYLAPVVLSFFLLHAALPLLLASASTVLTLIGFLASPAGINAWVAGPNRTIGVLTVWLVAVAGHVFIRARTAVAREQWLYAGQVGLSRQMSDDLSVPDLAGNVLRQLAEHTGAQAAAIFIRSSEHFTRQATYGVPDGAPIPMQVLPGAGLLGQAVKDDRPFVLRDVPEDYLLIGSGLARGRPRHLLIAPVRADGEVNGVLELGFLEEPGETATQLLERVSQSIGLAIRSAAYRTRMRELLEETQRQAEELQLQGDQLRASNEELEEQARALQESQARLEEQQTELESANTGLAAERRALERSEARLKAQAAELEQASRYKSEFLANMSLELRTPLNASMIMARLLADNRGGNLTEEQVRYSETIEASGKDLLALINDVLDLSKIEAGGLEIASGRVAVAELAVKVAASFEPGAVERGLKLTARVAPDTPAEIETDPRRLEQVLNNFLSNALKFTPAGEIAIDVGPAGDGRIAFAVRDTGIGIPPEQQEIIFEAFRQGDGSTGHGGTGLGLSIARELARLLGGEIDLASKQGAGSTFTLMLPPARGDAPARAGAARPAPRPPPAGAPAARPASFIEDDRERLTADARVVLVVEDDAAFARVLRDLAHELGLQCVAAAGADEGVALARQLLPHAVILDIELPDHTGMSVLDRLKHNVRTRHIPVHVVSAHDRAEAALSGGAAGYMLKPVRREELAQALKGLEGRLEQRLRRVLVVEDDARELDGIRALLSSESVETVPARTAAACLDALTRQTFDCMVLDLSLPDLSGFELLDLIARDDRYPFPPVIIHTGRDLTPEEELKLRRFSKSVIIKGARSPDRLIEEVTLFLHQVVAELPTRQQRLLAQSLGRDAQLEGRRILIVEDDVRNVFSRTSILEPHGAMLIIARNRKEALAALDEADAADEPIELVLMDVMMPEMDGLSATREIRRQERWKSLAVIVLTAKAMPQDHERCLSAGASDYVAKPIDVDKLLSLVRVWMLRRGG